jgi:hypothetical protein
MVNIEGGKKNYHQLKAMHNPTKKRGGSHAYHSPSCVEEALFNRGGVAKARHCTLPFPTKKHTLRGMGGGGKQVVFTLASPTKHSTAIHLNTPPPPIRKTKHSCNRGGGGTGGVHRGVAQARHCKSPTPPPPLRRTKHSCDGGGEGVFIMGSFKQTLNVAYPPLTKPWRRTNTALNVPYPHPNHTSCPGNKNYIRLTYFR